MAVIKAEKRDGVGKYVAFDLRKEGRIPACYYGKGVENINLSLNEKEFSEFVNSGDRILDLDIDGNVKKAVLKAVQHEAIGHTILHADFRAIDENTPVHVEVDIELFGDSKGASLGGIVEQDLHMVAVECLPANLPEKIRVDLSALDVNSVWYVKDLPKITGVKYTSHADVAVVSCHVHSKAADEEAAPEAAE